jgi:hypothetical protein
MSNADQQQYFDDAREMFLTHGWQDFIEDIEGIVETLTLDAANTADDFFFCKGKLEALRVVLSYETAVKESESLSDIDD